MTSIGFIALLLFVSVASYITAIVKAKDGPWSFVHWLLTFWLSGAGMCVALAGIIYWYVILMPALTAAVRNLGL